MSVCVFYYIGIGESWADRLCVQPLGSLAGGAKDGFKFFWLTDSCPHTAEAVADLAPFKVLTLANVIADCLDL